MSFRTPTSPTVPFIAAWQSVVKPQAQTFNPFF